LGYASASEEFVGCSILLSRPHEADQRYVWPGLDPHKMINVFKSGMALFSRLENACGSITVTFAKALSPMEYPFYPVFPSSNGQGHLATLALNKPFRPSRGGSIIARINTIVTVV
jgi:hypothetical protein